MSQVALHRRWPSLLLGTVLVLMGLPLAWGGIKLVRLAGSSYYLVIGCVLIVSGVLMILRRALGAWLMFAAAVGTLAWAVWEVGLSFWPLVPRLAPFLVLCILTLLVLPSLRAGKGRAACFGLAGVLLLVAVGGFAAMFVPHGVLQPLHVAAGPASPPTGPVESRWQFYGHTPDGRRHVPYAQISPANVAGLRLAWMARTGDMTRTGVEDQNTPLQIGDTLYSCTPRNQVIALDADTGKERWRYDPGIRQTSYSRCRGLGFYEVPAEQRTAGGPGAAALCDSRIVMTTVKARLVELDARTGALCPGFGRGGIVDLTEKMGQVNLDWYFQTSAPTVVGRLIIIGSFITDGRAADMPGGVIRAFDAMTGAVVWAWDPGNPGSPTPPADGQTYSRSSPNMWSTPAFDEKLGMIYLPMGGGSTDFWGGGRSRETEQFGQSIVALDIATGQLRWSYQTVHHDLWDYDVPSQPALYDLPDGKGGTVPALVQLTKRGQIFLLDRRTGAALADVVERPVPTDVVPHERVSPTQPYSVGMPAIGVEPLTEKSMWGATFFDQLQCRIRFKELRYDGEFTPPNTTSSLLWPGYYGGMNWGSGTVTDDGLLVVNDIRMPQILTLVPQDKVDPKLLTPAHALGLYPQTGTPYAIKHDELMSSLGIPCHAPPWGTLSGIDLKTRKVVWQRPAGTIKDSVLPIGIRSLLPMPVGMPTLGGPLSTASGLTFYAGTQDFYLRAFDTYTGRELWKARLPVGAQATPMSYVSPATGKQYVLISAGGARLSPDHGDYIMAFALPDATK